MLAWIRSLIAGNPTPRKFAALAMKQLQLAQPTETFAFDEAQYVLRVCGGGTISLANIYADFCAAKGTMRAQELQRFARGIAQSRVPAAFADGKPRLLPVLRHLGGIDLALIDSGDLGKRLDEVMVFAPFSAELGVCVAIDNEDAIAQVGKGDLERWGVTFEQALGVAVDNLRHKAAPAFIEAGRGLFMANYADFYDGVRILLKELVWQLPLGGEPVAMVPNRGTLLVCGAEDEHALCAMITAARKVLQEQSMPLSSQMLRLRDDAWTQWWPPGAAGKMLRALQCEQQAQDYQTQQVALEAANARAAVDVFVAAQTVVRRTSDEELVSFTVLPKGIPTWLPVADVVILKETVEDTGLTVRWDDFASQAGHLLQPLGLVAARFKVLDYPSGACLDALRAKATSIADVQVGEPLRH